MEQEADLSITWTSLPINESAYVPSIYGQKGKPEYLQFLTGDLALYRIWLTTKQGGMITYSLEEK